MAELDLTTVAELREVVELLVDAMRRSDPDYVAAHDCEPCTDEDWNTAIEAGEDALEALDDQERQARHLRVISGTGGPSEQRELARLINALKATS